MSRNGKQQPARPRIELRQSTASPEEAAAIAAAIEQFLRDTTPPPGSAEPPTQPWQRAGLFEATGRGAAASTPWGDAEAWGRR
jgi:hypothetical protein